MTQKLIINSSMEAGKSDEEIDQALKELRDLSDNFQSPKSFEINIIRKKKLLVLDVNGLLCQKIFRYDKAKLPKSSSVSVVECGSFLVYKRPYCEDLSTFVWKELKLEFGLLPERNLNSVLECIVEGLKSKLFFVLDQSQCTSSGFDTMEKKGKPIFFKEMNKLWTYVNTTYSESEVQFFKFNTLLIDDKPYKALLNLLYSAIFFEEYSAENVDDDALGLKGELRLYLGKLADAGDIPCFVKRHLFGQPFITPLILNGISIRRLFIIFRRLLEFPSKIMVRAGRR